MLAIRRILCPIDFSEPAREALHFAADLAQTFGADLTLIHAYTVPGYAIPEGAVMAGPQVMAELLADVERNLAELRREAEARGAPRVATKSVAGAADHEILRTAREGKHDLIVMGTHGRTGLRHVLLGSVAEKVVRRATCPVLTVRPADHRLEQAEDMSAQP